MKFLIITNHSYMYWQFRKELTEKLLEKADVTLCTPFVGHEDDLANLGCKMVESNVDRRGLNPLKDFKLFTFYLNLMKKEKPDMVITYSIKPNIYAGMACRFMKVPYCVNVQGLGTAFQKKGIAQIATLLYKFALKGAKTTFFENEANAKEFRDRKIQKSEKQTVLNGAGVNLEYYNYVEYPRNEEIHFLYLGRIMKEKGIDELLYAVRKLKNDNVKFVLDLVGFYEDSYKDVVNELVEEKIAVFHGFQSDPRSFYAACDCVVLPSYHEGMSNVLLEAAATGRPIITSDIPGCREAVNENVSGILVSPQNKEKLYNALKSFSEKSFEERKQMGKNGRLLVEEKFDKLYVVKKTVDCLFSV